ncbi:hypothetical protein BDV23DRAFT_112886 [Aspergillus alliaceus]|uniref:Uncharacterized protein n=1 Tax=Petromyces alliaceus TaxID=209559 RepID=A0A5N6FQ70_PETAA|nr:uncharacterized protein BDW43DRAFT_126954 [Aspergillus alliaceus]KAB8232141.1 hypothetical protein BDW43DRAFT_126954 [Aspergillus alliaceus]KAE8388363.1 hypothetical protein BDV23DRAFT_112886 [Aspergillus alliaceus]
MSCLFLACLLAYALSFFLCFHANATKSMTLSSSFFSFTSDFASTNFIFSISCPLFLFSYTHSACTITTPALHLF